jgi:hypothetical protein
MRASSYWSTSHLPEPQFSRVVMFLSQDQLFGNAFVIADLSVIDIIPFNKKIYNTGTYPKYSTAVCIKCIRLDVLLIINGFLKNILFI